MTFKNTHSAFEDLQELSFNLHEEDERNVSFGYRDCDLAKC